MHVCLCQGITDRNIKDAVNNGCCSYKEVRQSLGLGKQCGKCGPQAKQIVDDILTKSQLAQPVVIEFNPAQAKVSY